MEMMREPTMLGACLTGQLESIAKFGHGLTLGRYVGAADLEDDGVSFEAKFSVLNLALEKKFRLSAELNEKINMSLARVPR
ncbi:MAG: hypothetical protein AAGM04_00545 [Pseudomonadota bacterium]